MISVIIPTLWKAKELETMLPVLSNHPLVGEILIYNNDTAAQNEQLLKLKKVKNVPQKTNIFVNPAWNLGVKKAKYDKICLMSDDIVFDARVFDVVYDKITDSVGTIGPHGKCIKKFYVQSPLVRIEPSSEFWHGYGTLLFIHKKNYLPVPKEFLIYFGDVWQYDYNLIQGRQNYCIKGFCVKTEMGTTSGSFKEMTDAETEIHRDLFEHLHKTFKTTDLFSGKPTVRVKNSLAFLEE